MQSTSTISPVAASTQPSKTVDEDVTGPNFFSWSDISYDVLLAKKQRKAAKANVKNESRESTTTPQEKADFSPNEVEHGTISSDSTDILTEQVDTFDHLPPLDPIRRRVLNGVSGHVKRGEMVAVLGASGAGKTSLLSILSARLDKSADIAGQVLFQSKQRDPTTWKRLTGFVEQDDLMFSALTVQETLEYSAELRLPSRVYSKPERRQRVQDSISMLRLEKCADTLIGGPDKRGISGGERKRLAVATELVSDVSILLLDEPTSGLDAYAAHSLVTNLKEITRERDLYTLMTIHQPSWSIFRHFDRVILLTRGQVYYSGPPALAPAWFSSLSHQTPEGVNPADYYISIAENYEKTNEAEKRVRALLSSWRENGAAFLASKADVAPSQETVQAPPQLRRGVSKTSDAGHIAGAWPNSWLHELMILTHRNLVLLRKDPTIVIASFAQNFVLLIVIGFAFFRLDNDQGGALGRIGALFIVPVNASFATLFPILAIFPLQRSIMLRERAAGTYRTSSFYVSKVVTEVPNQLLQRALFYIVVYWMLGLDRAVGSFFIWIAINFLQVGTAIGLGLAIGSGSRSIEASNIFAPLINVIFLLFGGNLLPLSSIPPWFVWLHWLSPITYTYSALAQNEFRDISFSCDADSSQCYRTGQDVLTQYSLRTFTIAENAGFLAAIATAFTFIGYLLLRFTGKPSFRYVTPKPPAQGTSTVPKANVS